MRNWRYLLPGAAHPSGHEQRPPERRLRPERSLADRPPALRDMPVHRPLRSLATHRYWLAADSQTLLRALLGQSSEAVFLEKPEKAPSLPQRGAHDPQSSNARARLAAAR